LKAGEKFSTSDIDTHSSFSYSSLACHTYSESGALLINSPVILKAGEKFSTSDIDTHSNAGIDGLFVEGTRNAEFADGTKPAGNDVILKNRKNFNAFAGTDLKAVLERNKIQRLFIMGFLTNMWIEDTVIELSENMPNIATYVLIDGCAGNSDREHFYATGSTLPMFSTLVTCSEAQTLLYLAPDSRTSGVRTSINERPSASRPPVQPNFRPRILALSGARSNDNVTKLQLENLCITEEDGSPPPKAPVPNFVPVSEVSSIALLPPIQVALVKLNHDLLPEGSPSQHRGEGEGGATIKAVLEAQPVEKPFLYAARGTDDDDVTTYGDVSNFIHGGAGDLRRLAVNAGEVEAYAAPPGGASAAALAFLSIGAQTTAAPLAPNTTEPDALDALDQFKANNDARRPAEEFPMSLPSRGLEQARSNMGSSSRYFASEDLPKAEPANTSSVSWSDRLNYRTRSAFKELMRFRALKLAQVLLALYIGIMTLADMGPAGGLRDTETGLIVDQESTERTARGLILVNGTERAIVAATQLQVVFFGITRISAFFMYPGK
jgi:nicotinamidase-related amidase